MSNINQQLNDYIIFYHKKFKKPFPLMQSSGSDEEIIKQIKKCIAENKRAEEIWPKQYGACKGKYF